MIAKQYKNGARTGVERGKNGFGMGSRTGVERGKNGFGMGSRTGLKRGKRQVGTGVKIGFKRHKTRNLAKFYNLERRETAVLCRSTSFQPFFAVPTLFSPVFDDFRQKGEKMVVKKWRNGKGKKSVLSSFFPIPVFSLSFPRKFLAVSLWIATDYLPYPTINTLAF